MPHVIEPATSARARCRGCGERIDKGELRLGERMPNPYADGEMTLWFHVPCGAYKRPEAFLEALETTTETVERRDELMASARAGVEHRRLPRVDGAQRASTGRARCRNCHKLIPKGAWRIRLVYFDDARFEPSGFVHATCAKGYFETTEILDRTTHFGDDLPDADLAELRTEMDSAD